MCQLASIPNLLTIARLRLAPFVCRAILSGRHTAALVLFACAAVTDGLDGMLTALRQITSAGVFLDQSQIAFAEQRHLPRDCRQLAWWLVIVVLGRDVFLASSGIVMLLTDFRHQPSVWGKISTLVQIVCAIAWMLQNAGISPQLHTIAQALIWPTAAVTLWSGVYYIGRALRFLRVH
jgi:phosphatidylglycerophosphate synthase